MDIVWAVTTIRRHRDNDRPLRRSTTVGLYTTREKGDEVVEGNYGDLEEAGYYQYAVVGPIALNCLYPSILRFDLEDAGIVASWWEFNRDERRWERIDGEPQELIDEVKTLCGCRIASWTNL